MIGIVYFLFMQWYALMVEHHWLALFIGRIKQDDDMVSWIGLLPSSGHGKLPSHAVSLNGALTGTNACRSFMGHGWHGAMRVQQCHQPPILDGWNPTNFKFMVMNGEWFTALLYQHYLSLDQKWGPKTWFPKRFFDSRSGIPRIVPIWWSAKNHTMGIPRFQSRFYTSSKIKYKWSLNLVSHPFES